MLCRPSADNLRLRQRGRTPVDGRRAKCYRRGIDTARRRAEQRGKRSAALCIAKVGGAVHREQASSVNKRPQGPRCRSLTRDILSLLNLSFVLCRTAA